MDLTELGQALQSARLTQAISQATLCADVRISRSTLSSLENGHIAEIGIRKVMQLCDRLGLRLALEEAHERPTLRQLVRERDHTEVSSAIERKRAPRQDRKGRAP